MFIAIEFLFIFFLAAILFMVFKNDGFSEKNRARRAELEGCWAGKDRRQYPRFTKSLAITYSVVKNRIKKDDPDGKTVDISEGGVKLMLDEKLPPNTSLLIKIPIPEARQASEITGSVVWTEDAADVKESSGKRFFYSGVKFSTTKEPSGKYLIDYIRSIDGQSR